MKPLKINPIRVTFGAAMVILVALGILSNWTIKQLVDASGWVSHTHEVRNSLQRISANKSAAESAARNLVLTNDQRALESYYVSKGATQQAVSQGRTLTADNPSQQRNFDLLESELTFRFSLMQQLIQLESGREQPDAGVQRGLIAAGNSKDLEIDKTIAEMDGEEQRLLDTRSSDALRAAHGAKLIGSLGGAIALAALLMAFRLFQREVTQRAAAEQLAHESSDHLSSMLKDKQRDAAQIQRLGELSELLQSCRNLQEADKILVQCVPDLFPFCSGVFCRISPSRDLLESTATWGPEVISERTFASADCWALRRGRIHVVDKTRTAVRCAHIKPAIDAQSATLCIPMVGHGETLGVMVLAAPLSAIDSRPDALKDIEILAAAVNERISLAIANLNLRETLRSQAIRDPLTGLFNRRYLEESLDREVRRAVRKKRSLSAVMLDIDHFKAFNDAYGHDAGDAILRKFGLFLGSIVRAEDIACRYGGEEFAIILTEADARVALAKAERIREEAKLLVVDYKGQQLSAITVSLGVAELTETMASGADLLGAADAALYRSKNHGRDQVTLANGVEVRELQIAAQGPTDND